MKNKEDLILDSAHYFETHPRIKEISATADGLFFIESSEARGYANAKGLDWFIIKKSDLDNLLNSWKEDKPEGDQDLQTGDKVPPIVETPTPVVEAPVEETPAVEAPIVEAPVAETSVEETPVAKAPVKKVNKPKAKAE